MFEYTSGTVDLLEAVAAVVGATFFVMLLLGGIADAIKDAFFGGGS